MNRNQAIRVARQEAQLAHNRRTEALRTPVEGLKFALLQEAKRIDERAEKARRKARRLGATDADFR